MSVFEAPAAIKPGFGAHLPAWSWTLFAFALLYLTAQIWPGADIRLAPPIDWAGAVNSAEDWLRTHYRETARSASRLIAGWVFAIETFLNARPWPVIVLFFAALGQVFGGWKLTLLSLVSVLSWAVFRQWDTSLQTLSLVAVSVVLCLVVGFPIGVLSGTNRVVRTVLTPILDAMQTMPAFVYLVPAIFFFGVGATTAVLATFIYALPPIIRLTSHGLYATPKHLIEVGDSFGASNWQSFARIRLPHAMSAVFVGVNQTIMMVLGLVVLAGMVGAPGLGTEIWLALQRLNIGRALEGGICIVFMAILLDRLVNAMTAPKSVAHAGWLQNGIAGKKTRIWGVAAVIAVLALLDAGLRTAELAERFPRSFEVNMRPAINSFVDWLVNLPWLYQVTETLTWIIYTWLLNPLQSALLAPPFWAVTAAMVALGYGLGHWRIGLLAGLTCFVFAFTGLWEPSMQTLASVTVSVLVCAIIGVPLAIWSGRNVRVEQALRPVLDTMQTMPAFVYLVPVIMLFGGNLVAALIATVIYALPPLVRIGAMGFRDIPVEVDEAMTCFGTSPLHGFFRIRLPLAVPALVAGVNQSIMMALAMQVITPLIGGGGLGREIYHGLGLADSGRALVAGVCVVLMAILLDRALGRIALKKSNTFNA